MCVNVVSGQAGVFSGASGKIAKTHTKQRVKTSARMKDLANLLPFFVIFSLFPYSLCNIDPEEGQSNERYQIEGKVANPLTNDQEWISNARILVDGGESVGFIKQVLLSGILVVTWAWCVCNMCVCNILYVCATCECDLI